jgi:hypothetical protein
MTPPPFDAGQTAASLRQRVRFGLARTLNGLSVDFMPQGAAMGPRATKASFPLPGTLCAWELHRPLHTHCRESTESKSACGVILFVACPPGPAGVAYVMVMLWIAAGLAYADLVDYEIVKGDLRGQAGRAARRCGPGCGIAKLVKGEIVFRGCAALIPMRDTPSSQSK